MQLLVRFWILYAFHLNLGRKLGRLTHQATQLPILIKHNHSSVTASFIGFWIHAYGWLASQAGFWSILNTLVLFRDLKPCNICIGRKDPRTLYIIDFGLCRQYKKDGKTRPPRAKVGKLEIYLPNFNLDSIPRHFPICFNSATS
jgi:serine/threonine protein kinase